MKEVCRRAFFPLRVEIEPTNECNSFCAYCPRRFMKYPPGFMDMKLYEKIIDEACVYPRRTLVLFRRGESLLNPYFADMLKYAKGKFKEIQLATNASLMNKKIAGLIADTVDMISFSLELPERYKRYRSLSYRRVLKNIEYFISINKKTTVQVSMVKTEDIKKEDVMRFKKQWQKKVDRVRIYEQHSGDGRFGSLRLSRRKRVTCVKPFSDILIFWDGKVGRCNHDWGADPLGDVRRRTIKEIWESQRYKNLREQQNKVEIKDRVCRDCDSWYEAIGECRIGEVYEKNK